MERAAPRDAPTPASTPACAQPRPYLPRRPQASPLYRVLADHFATLERVHEERFEPTHGPPRAAVLRAVGRFLDCGLIEHGFALVRCDTCRAEFLVAFRCKGRQFCPSCHARRLAEWSLWLDERLLAPVAHRQVVLPVPKRLRAYFVHDHRRLGRLSRLATRTLRAYVQAAVGEQGVVPGLIVCVQTSGSVAHVHPHLHVLMSDGAFRRDGTFVRLPEPEAAVLEELWRRAVLAEFVRRGWLEEDAAAGMLAWPHSRFGAYLGPERYEVRARYAGAYATRRRVWWRLRGVELVASPSVVAPPPEPAGDWPALRARRRRWAELLRMVFKIEVEVGARCGGAMRILGFVTEAGVVRRILAHLERRGVEARAGPWASAVAAPG